MALTAARASVAHALKRLGWANGLLYLGARGLARVSRGHIRLVKYYFVAQSVPQGTLLAARKGSLSIAPVEPGDALTKQFPRPEDVIARRFAEGAVCLAVCSRQRFAGFIWLKLGPYEEDEVRCRYLTLPADRTAWDFDVYVDPAFRMGRAFASLWDAANALLRERGVAWTLSRISAFNPDSLRAHARFGVRRIGVATFVCVGALQLMVASACPFVHVSLFSRPVLRLRAPLETMDPVR